MSEADYAGLVTAADRYLNAPVFANWDNLHTHLSRKMRAFSGSHPARPDSPCDPQPPWTPLAF